MRKITVALGLIGLSTSALADPFTLIAAGASAAASGAFGTAVAALITPGLAFGISVGAAALGSASGGRQSRKAR